MDDQGAFLLAVEPKADGDSIEREAAGHVLPRSRTAWERRMKRTRLIIIGVALVAGLTAAYLSNGTHDPASRVG